MREATARALHKHRRFLHDASLDPRRLHDAAPEQICAILHLVCSVLRRELAVPEKVAKAFRRLPNADFLKEHFLDRKKFAGLVKDTATVSGHAGKVIKWIGKSAAKLALKVFKWLF